MSRSGRELGVRVSFAFSQRSVLFTLTVDISMGKIALEGILKIMIYQNVKICQKNNLFHSEM